MKTRLVRRMKRFHPYAVANAMSAEGCRIVGRPRLEKMVEGLPRVTLERIVTRLEAGKAK